MSANNYILIDRKTFNVSMKDIETGTILQIYKKCKSLDEAIDTAMENVDETEYGIYFTNK